MIALLAAIAIHTAPPPPLTIEAGKPPYVIELKLAAALTIQPPAKIEEAAPIAPPAPTRPPVTVGVNDYDWGYCTWGVANWVKVPGHLGNASMWAINARALGYTVSDVAQPGAVGQTSAGYAGHVVLVLEVDGSRIRLREMNGSGGLGVADERWAPASDFVYILF